MFGWIYKSLPRPLQFHESIASYTPDMVLPSYNNWKHSFIRFCYKYKLTLQRINYKKISMSTVPLCLIKMFCTARFTRSRSKNIWQLQLMSLSKYIPRLCCEEFVLTLLLLILLFYQPGYTYTDGGKGSTTTCLQSGKWANSQLHCASKCLLLGISHWSQCGYIS